MILLFENGNTSKCCLAFRKDGGKISIALSDLDPNESYRVAVSFFEHDHSIKIID